jgi:DNA-binding NarL/FixJ family response regulator
MAIRVVLAEDNYLLREGLARLLDRAPEVEVLSTCGTYDDLLAAVVDDRPDVVITDIRMPPTQTDEGIRAASELRTSHPHVGVVVLSQFVSPAYALALLADGTKGRAYLLKDRVDDLDRLVDAVRAVAAGGSVIDPQVIEQLVDTRSQRSNSVLKSLTPRELEILREIATGKSNAAIAATVYLSERAIEKHTNSIFSKLGITAEPDVNRRVKAVLMYLSEQSRPE